MSEHMPAAFVLPHINLKDVPSVLIDIDRLLESDFWLSTNGEESRAGMCLWLKSYKQVPAGSLPDDDTSLARLCNVAPEHWSSVREKALHGWIKCEDGRLYHRVVSEKVLLMHMVRLVARIRGAKGMEVRYNIDRDEGNDSVALLHEIYGCLELLEGLATPEAQREAKKFRDKYKRTLTSDAGAARSRKPTAKKTSPEQKDLLGAPVTPESGSASSSPVVEPPSGASPKKPRAVRPDGSTYSSAFAEFWTLYPKKDAKQKAAIAWAKGDLDSELQKINADVRRRKMSPEWQREQGQFVPLPATYLNARRWDNDIDPAKIVDKPVNGKKAPAALPLPADGVSVDTPWFAQAGFTSAAEAMNDGCQEGKQSFFKNGIRIKDVYGKPRSNGEMYDDLCHRVRRWMSNFTNQTFYPERDHALRMMHKMPSVDFWGVLRSKTREEDQNALRTLLMALPADSATGKALRV